MDNLSKPRVLIVDDNEKNIVVMKKLLAELPIEVDSVTSGVEALKIVLRHKYAVIYLDVQMPEMDGYEVAEHLSSSEETANMPIVFVTAIYNDEQNILRGYSSGAIDYLSKPINPDLLIAKTKIFVQLFEQQEKLEQAVAMLDQLARNDTLTGLPNRYQFSQLSQKILALNARNKTEFALLLMDLDNFKHVNDTYGHDAGDMLLQEVANRLTKRLRQSDYIARLGGDEFVIILPQVKSVNDIHLVACAIIKMMEEPFLLESQEMQISASIGVAMYPIAGTTIDELMKSADLALYRAKHKGKNTYEEFSSTDLNFNLRPDEVCAKLKKDIADNKLCLKYEPAYLPGDDKISRYECLVEWNNPDVGVVEFDQVLLYVEEMGISNELLEHVLVHGYADFQKKKAKHSAANLQLGIKLSPYQIYQQDFFKVLERVKQQVNLSEIEFNIDYTVLSDKSERLKQSLDQLKAFGVSIAIDSFGSKDINLLQLIDLPISTLKLDRAIRHEIKANSGGAMIFSAIKGMASPLNLTVIECREST